MSKQPIRLVVIAGAIALALSGCANTAGENEAAQGGQLPFPETAAPGPSKNPSRDTTDETSEAEPAPDDSPDTSADPGSEADDDVKEDDDDGDESDDDAACGGPTAQDAYASAIGRVPLYGGNNWAEPYDWSTYDACAGPSWLVLELESGTGGSPSQVLLFHRGEYVGRMAGEDLKPVQRVESVGEYSVRVVWREPLPGESNAEASGRPTGTFTFDPDSYTFDIQRTPA